MKAYQCSECKEVAFCLIKEPAIGERVVSENVILPDGSRPTPMTPIVCGSCQAPIKYLRISRLVDVGDEEAAAMSLERREIESIESITGPL